MDDDTVTPIGVRQEQAKTGLIESVGQLEPIAAQLAGGSNARHLYVDRDDKVLVMVDGSASVQQVQQVRGHLATFLGIDPVRVTVLAGGRDIVSVTVDHEDGDDGERSEDWEGDPRVGRDPICPCEDSGVFPDPHCPIHTHRAEADHD
jgi:hypothetical protein